MVSTIKIERIYFPSKFRKTMHYKTVQRLYYLLLNRRDRDVTRSPVGSFYDNL